MVLGSKISLKAIAADDDEPTCNLLSSLLETFEEVTVVGKAGTGKEMLDLVRESLPDIVFVDVKMPDLDGLSAVHRLQQEHPGVFVVFVSAHAHYAAEAFNLDAVDYLVKPVSRERLSRALAKGKRFKEMQSAAGNETASSGRVAGGVEGNGADYHNKLFVKSGHGMVVIETEKILFIEKTGRKCVIHTGGDRYETTERLASLEQKLDPARFFRCHKSFIINVNRVEKILPIPRVDRAYEVTFHNYPQKAAMRRDKFKEFCRIIKC
ncbi:MAG: LytTR family DNA-binding domain-containing protein [Bacillota bacterium]|jgi:DNA-binding LytR/AlgR family response regulator